MVDNLGNSPLPELSFLCVKANTIGCGYNTVKYNIICIYCCSDYGRIKIRVWTHRIHPIACHNQQTMGCYSWGQWKMTVLWWHHTLHTYACVILSRQGKNDAWTGIHTHYRTLLTAMCHVAGVGASGCYISQARDLPRPPIRRLPAYIT